MLRIAISDSSGERSFQTERCEVLVGRREGVDLLIEDQAASRTHCVLRVEKDGVRVVDLGTANGTIVAGRRVERARLRPGGAFTIGTTTLRLVSYAGAGAAAADAAGAPPTAPAATAGAAADFGREIREMLSKTPWYGLSLVIHILALMLLDLVTYERPDRAALAHIENSGRDASLEPEKVGLEEPNLDDFEPEEALIEEEADPEPEAASEPETAPDPTEFSLVPEVGVGTGMPAPRRLIRPLPRKPKLAGSDAAVNKGDLAGEHADATKIVRQGLGGRGIPRNIRAERILVMEGEFDKIELVLDGYGIKYRLITREQMLRKNFPLAKLLFINCGRKPAPSKRQKLVSRVKSFVQRGGWVTTSDWSVEPYLTDGFPDRVKRQRPSKRQSDTTVTVHPATETSPILEGVFYRRSRTDWWLEETSSFFKVTPGRANVLIVSEDMQRRFGHGIVAFEFRVNRGRVLHLLGHFYQKDGNKMGLVGMHRLILNLIRQRFPGS